MEEILKSVTTPLALAALAFLVLGGALSLRKKSTDTGKRNQLYIFVIVLTLSVMANLIYLAQVLLFSETLLFGTVRDVANGDAVKSAIVDIFPGGRTATTDDGSFLVAIPYSRQQDKYKVFVRALGYDSKTIELNQRRPAPFVIELTERRPTLGNGVNVVSEITITQNVGDPIVIVQVKTENNFGRDYQIEDIRLKIKPKNSEELVFIPHGMQFLGMPTLLPPVYPLPVPQGRTTEMSIFLNPNPKRLADFFSAVAPTSTVQWFDLCARVHVLPDNVNSSFQQYFDSAFFWKAGEYQVTLEFKIDGKLATFSKSMSLGSEVENAFKQMRLALHDCGGVMINFQQVSNLYYQTGPRANFRRVSLQ